jgi:hypothetical protein
MRSGYHCYFDVYQTGPWAQNHARQKNTGIYAPAIVIRLTASVGHCTKAHPPNELVE